MFYNTRHCFTKKMGSYYFPIYTVHYHAFFFLFLNLLPHLLISILFVLNVYLFGNELLIVVHGI